MKTQLHDGKKRRGFSLGRTTALRGPQRPQTDAKKARNKRHAVTMAGDIGAAVLIIFSIIAVTAAMIAGCDRVVRSSLFSVREVIVKGLTEVTEKDVLSLAGISAGGSLLTVNREAIARRVCRNAWIKDVFVGREFPNRLVIWVKERAAVALIERENMLHLVDGNGEVFKRLAPEENAYVPVLTGFFSGETLNSALVGKSLLLIEELKRSQAAHRLGAVSEVHGDETFGFSIFTDRGLCLKLGFEGYDDKFKRLAAVMDDMEKKNLKTNFMIIDLTNPEKINIQPYAEIQAGETQSSPAKGKKLRI
jgi:cell division protein FtsQ